jgi:phytoene dehydrogenase-like protein
MATNPDVIVIGAGHNGLVAATYLAKAGRKVLVLERRDAAGGQLAGPSLHPAGLLRPDIVGELDLARHGLPATAGKAAVPPFVSLLPGGERLQLSSNPGDAATLEAIRRHSPRDAARWPEFLGFLDTAAGFLDAAYRTPMPRMVRDQLRANAMPLAALAWKLRRLGGKDMFRVIRSLSMSAQELTDDWFEAEPLKAAIGALAIHGHTLGSMSAGTGYTLIHNWLNRGGLAHRTAEGDPSRLVGALVAALQAAGGQLRTSAPVAQILVDKQQVHGVRLEGGEEVGASVVLSALDPRRTLLGLVGAPELPPEFAWHTQSIKLRGAVAKLELQTDGRHGLPAGTLVVAPTLKYLERAYDAAKYGEISQRPYLELTTRGDALAVHVQFAPHTLRTGDWASERATLERRTLDTLAEYCPTLPDSIRGLQSITPLELEQDWGLTEGDLNHGQLILDQILFMRPLPGWSDHRTPVDGLYLCGGGVHGGGGISGASGRNAARMLRRT